MASRENEFIEPVSGKWFYIIESTDAPKNSWDWREYAECFGPFDTLERAQEHLYDSHADTSGSTIHALGDFKDDAVYCELRLKSVLTVERTKAIPARLTP